MESPSTNPAFPPRVDEIQEAIPGFHIAAALATGDLSAVYLATQLSLDRKVAIRLYSPVASRDESLAASVEAMAQSMARLNHPNLIAIYNSGKFGGMIYQVMEFVPGKSLARSLGGHAIDPAQAKSITRAICHGLAHAHENEVAHGSLTPDDILLTPATEPKIGKFRGGDFPKDQKNDIAALGGILYQMLTGQTDGPDALPPSEIVGTPVYLDDVWERSTRTDHPEAYSSIEEMRLALDEPVPPLHSTNKPARRNRTEPPTTRIPSTPRTVVAAPVISPQVPAGRPIPVSTHGSHWLLARNIIVILLLLFSIKLVLDLREKKKSQIREIEAEQAAKLQSSPPKPVTPARNELRANLPNFLPSASAPSSQTTTAPTSARSLAQLRSKLAGGSREEFPEGTNIRNECAYLFVDQDLSWPEACWFAEQHGAHLACPSPSTDVLWLAGLAKGQTFWLGAGRSGRKSWSLVDGSPWAPETTPSGLGNYIASDKHGFLRATHAQTRLPLILQWHLDGSNPGSLETLLRTVAPSTTTEDPSFPSGTHIVGEHAYLLVVHHTDWENAKRLAHLANGHLAVVSSTAESVHIGDLLEPVSDTLRFWLGASKSQDSWSWITREPWKAHPIDQSRVPTGSALCSSSSHEWQAAEPTSLLDGFIIEWSRDSGSAPAPQTRLPNLENDPTPSLSTLDVQAKNLLQQAILKRNKALKDNTNRMSWDLDIVFRNMTGSEKSEWGETIQHLKNHASQSRLPDSLVDNDQWPASIRKIVTYTLTKQKSLDEEYDAMAEKTRLAYQKRLKEISARIVSQAQPETSEIIDGKIQSSSEAKSWQQSLGVEL